MEIAPLLSPRPGCMAITGFSGGVTPGYGPGTLRVPTPGGMAFANLHDDRICLQADGPFFHTIMHDEDTMGLARTSPWRFARPEDCSLGRMIPR